MPDHGARETRENGVVEADPKPADPVRRARSISSVDEAAALYRDWASTYDDDVFGTLAFTGSGRIAELLVAFLADRAQPVIDLGCGTGAVGRRLAELGVSTIDGLDLSPEMLAVAATTGAYRNLSIADLNQAADLPDGRVCGFRQRRNLHQRSRRTIGRAEPACACWARAASWHG